MTLFSPLIHYSLIHYMAWYHRQDQDQVRLMMQRKLDGEAGMSHYTDTKLEKNSILQIKQWLRWWDY